MAMGKRTKDLTGKQFGILTVVEFDSIRKGSAFWLCRCECGQSSVARSASLTGGQTKSCGCKIGFHTHGHSGTATYKIWNQMMQRCYNPGQIGFKYYGGRGIRVCERWHDYLNFLADMGERPAGLTIDRKDGGMDYCPENCRWATTKEQGRNRSTTLFVDLSGERVPLGEACDRLGLNYHTAYYRITHNLPLTG